jgi:hypothetical protein
MNSHLPRFQESYNSRMRFLIPFALLVSVGAAAFAETPLEHSHETRFQLDFWVPPAALATYLPAGWQPNIATTGAAKDCNLRVVFIDRVTINKPDARV